MMLYMVLSFIFLKKKKKFGNFKSTWKAFTECGRINMGISNIILYKIIIVANGVWIFDYWDFIFGISLN